MTESQTSVGPHDFAPKGWRRWICCHCYGPRALHPRRGWVRARPLHDNAYLSSRAPHFNEGW
ncbi:hypothetical protein ACWET9_22640 [Streptomyces sp. NPDC004059]